MSGPYAEWLRSLTPDTDKTGIVYETTAPRPRSEAVQRIIDDLYTCTDPDCEATHVDMDALPEVEFVEVYPGGPLGGGWHYPTQITYEDQSHIIRGEN